MPWSVRAIALPDGDQPSDLWVDAAGCLSARPVPDAEPLPGRYVAPGLVDAHAHPAVAPGPAARDGAGTLDQLAGWAAAYSLRAVEAMTAAVHAAGGRVAAHVTTAAVADLVRAGIDSVEHGNSVDETVLAMMAQAGAAWTPTLCAVLAVPATASDAARQRAAAHRERLRELIPAARRLGVPVLTGTDIAGTIVREITLLAELGLDPAAALAAATTTGYRFLGEPFGQLGRPATLVTYSGDPREDLAVLSSPRAVLIDGVRVR